MEDDILITGISGRFPGAANLEMYWKNGLKSEGQQPASTNNNYATKLTTDGAGFDHDFFGIKNGDSENSESEPGHLNFYLAQLLEVAYEAIVDSGTSLSEIYAKDVGLFLHVASEPEAEKPKPGNENLSQQIVELLEFTGPKEQLGQGQDKGSVNALVACVNAIRSGKCDQAIVAGINIHGTLNETDQHVLAFFVQKRSLARREYATLTFQSNEQTQNEPESAESGSGRTKIPDLIGVMKLILQAQFGVVGDSVEDVIHHLGRLAIENESEPHPGVLGSGLKFTPKSKITARRTPMVPVLVPLAGRSKDALQETMQKILACPRNCQLDSLLQKVAEGEPAPPVDSTGTEEKPFGRNPVRGFLIRGNGSVQSDYQVLPPQKMPLWLVFSGTPGSLWTGMANDLMKFDVFSNSILKSTEVLAPYMNLYQMVTQGDEEMFDRYLGTGYLAMGIAFIDLLLSIGLEPDGYIGHSGGELLCGYLDGCLTREEALVSYYWKDEYVQLCLGGSMASIGLSWDQAVRVCPPWIIPACNNAKKNVTVAGLSKDIPSFLEILRSERVLGIEVNSGGVAYHTRYLKPMMADFESKLKEVFGSEKAVRKRSAKWISTSIPEKDWGKGAEGDDMIEYILNNVRNPVLFYPVLKFIPKHATVLEVTPNAHMVQMLEMSLGKTCPVLGLVKRDGGNNAVQLLTGLGKLYENGYPLQVFKLYPKTELPAPLGTPMISPLVTWKHQVAGKSNKIQN